jgi:phage baseplate assembly protein V
VSPDLLDLISGRAEADTRIYGVATSRVTSNEDPEKLGRVKLRFDWLGGDLETGWARVALTGAGDQRGTFWIPEVGDEVLVAFDRGDPRLPYVIGGLYNQNEAPAESGDGMPLKRSLTSSRGHVIRLDDTDDGDCIEIVDRTGDNSIVIKSADGKLEISAKGDIRIASASGKVSIEGKDVEIKATSDAAVTADGKLDLKASGAATLKGATVDIN